LRLKFNCIEIRTQAACNMFRTHLWIEPPFAQLDLPQTSIKGNPIPSENIFRRSIWSCATVRKTAGRAGKQPDRAVLRTICSYCILRYTKHPMLFTHGIETGPWAITERARRVKRSTEKGIDCGTEKAYHQDMMERVLGLSSVGKPSGPFSFDMLSRPNTYIGDTRGKIAI
jgi:hypothetical protein